MKKSLVLTLAIGLVMALGGVAMAQNNTNALTVQASVTGTCKFSSGTSTLNFGALDPSSGANVNASTTTQFWCTKGVTETVGAGNGANYGGSPASRRMVESGGDLIPYSLTLTPDANSNQGPTSPRTLTITGQVLGTDYITKTAGNYSDQVTLTINP